MSHKYSHFPYADFPYIDDFCDDEVFVFSTMGQGPAGEVGNPGPQGPQGEKGDPGKDGILSFDTVTDMQASTDLKAGMTVHTNGFHEIGDGGSAYYTISENGVANGLDIIQCESLIATLSSGLNNPTCYGADSKGNIDSSTSINRCIEVNHNSNIVFSTGKYHVESPIELDYMLDYATCIDFNGSTIESDDSSMDYLLGIGTKNYQSSVPSGGDFNKEKRCCFIRNFHFVTNAEWAIYIERNFLNARIESFEIETSCNGIYIGAEHDGQSTRPTDAYLTNFVMTNKDMQNDYVGILIHNTDNKIAHGRIYGFKVGIRGYPSYVDEIHFLATNLPTDGTFKMTNDWCCILPEGAAVPMITNCYCDTIPCFLKTSENVHMLFVSGITIYAYGTSENYMSEASIFDFKSMATVVDPNINISNVIYWSGTYPDFAKLIELPALTSISDSASGILKDATISSVKVTNVVKNPDIIKELWRKQVEPPFRGRYYASSNTPAGEWQPLCTIIAPRSEQIFLDVSGPREMYRIRLQSAKESNAIRISSSENITATPFSSDLKYKVCGNDDGYFDVYIRKSSGATTPNFSVADILSTFAIVIPAYKNDVAQSTPAYTDDELAGMYTSIVSIG